MIHMPIYIIIYVVYFFIPYLFQVPIYRYLQYFQLSSNSTFISISLVWLHCLFSALLPCSNSSTSFYVVLAQYFVLIHDFCKQQFDSLSLISISFSLFYITTIFNKLFICIIMLLFSNILLFLSTSSVVPSICYMFYLHQLQFLYLLDHHLF